MFKVPLAPQANRLSAQIKFISNSGVAHSVGSHKHYAGSSNKSVRKTARICYAVQLLSFFILKEDGLLGVMSVTLCKN